MMTLFNPQIHNRRSLRLNGYDYSLAGLYFITLCVQDRACLFGGIDVGAPRCGCPDDTLQKGTHAGVQKGTHTGVPLRGCCGNDAEVPKCGYPILKLNDAGKMVERWYFELENKFPDKICHEMVVMPNHMHFIIENVPNPVGAPLCGCPFDDTLQMGTHIGVPLPASDAASQPEPRRVSPNQKFNATIGDVMDWFKTMTTNEYIRGVKNLGWEPFNNRLWQRNYYEHIIRNDFAYERISEYIIQNPLKWMDDKYFC